MDAGFGRFPGMDRRDVSTVGDAMRRSVAADAGEKLRKTRRPMASQLGVERLLQVAPPRTPRTAPAAGQVRRLGWAARGDGGLGRLRRRAGRQRFWCGRTTASREAVPDPLGRGILGTARGSRGGACGTIGRAPVAGGGDQACPRLSAGYSWEGAYRRVGTGETDWTRRTGAGGLPGRFAGVASGRRPRPSSTGFHVPFTRTITAGRPRPTEIAKRFPALGRKDWGRRTWYVGRRAVRRLGGFERYGRAAGSGRCRGFPGAAIAGHGGGRGRRANAGPRTPGSGTEGSRRFRREPALRPWLPADTSSRFP